MSRTFREGARTSAAPPAHAMQNGIPDPAAANAAVVLVRHGETDDNVAPLRFQGHADTPLNATGRDQAQALAAHAGPDHGYRALWSSDLDRAMDTAAPLGEQLELDVRPDARLREGARGGWEGLLMDDVAAAEPEAFAAWKAAGAGFRFPGGESLAEHRDRARAALAGVLAGPLPALVVCHGGTIRCLLLDDLGAFHEMRVPNCSAWPLDATGSLIE